MPLPAKSSGTGSQSMSELLAGIGQGVWSQDHRAELWQPNVHIMLFKLEYHPSVFWNHIAHIQLDWGSKAVQPKVSLFLFKSMNHQTSNPFQPGVVFRFHKASTSLAAAHGKSAPAKLFGVRGDLRGQCLSGLRCPWNITYTLSDSVSWCAKEDDRKYWIGCCQDETTCVKSA